MTNLAGLRFIDSLLEVRGLSGAESVTAAGEVVHRAFAAARPAR